MSKFERFESDVIKLRSSGLGSLRISKELGVSKSAVKSWLKKLEIGGKLDEYKPREYKIVCKCCGLENLMANEKAMFCNDKCRAEYNRRHRGSLLQCKNCRSSFKSYKDKKFCNRDCFLEYKRNNKVVIPKEINKKISKECLHCGAEYQTSCSTSKYCSSTCGYKYKQAEKAAKKKLFNIKCKECGKHFSTTNRQRVFCSNVCGNKYKSRISEVKRRKTIKNNGKVDWEISIERLIKRDGSTCYLCGYKCDTKDYIVTEGGTIITGEDYPSIEHVIPVSKGGTHTWDNVKVAHRGCNNLKGVKIISSKQEILN